MDLDPLANLFKGSNYDEPIPSNLDALDYLYKVLPEIREVTHDRSLNKKHDWNDFIINSFVVNCANKMQNPKLGDASFVMSCTCCNDHDRGDSFDPENLFKPHDEYEIDNIVCNIIESGFGEVMTLVIVNHTILEECQICKHVDHVENILCDSYFVEFAYDPTCNYYKRGKYGCRNFHVTKLSLVMLRLLLFLFVCLHMLVFA